jgi:hypothetical protein
LARQPAQQPHLVLFAEEFSVEKEGLPVYPRGNTLAVEAYTQLAESDESKSAAASVNRMFEEVRRTTPSPREQGKSSKK